MRGRHHVFRAAILVGVFAASSARSQLIASDDFSGYSHNFVTLDSCDATDGWMPFADTSSIDSNSSSFKEGTASLQLSYSDASHRSTAFKAVPTADLTSMAKIGFWAYVADNSHAQRFELRVGQPGNYREYRHTSEIYLGWNYPEFDLNNPYTVVGDPDMTAVSYLWVGYYYTAGESGAYWLVDAVTSYTAPNFTAGNFYYINGANLYGIANYQNLDGTNELLVNGISRYNSGNHGRVLYLDRTPDTFYASFDFRFNCDDHGVGWMRFLWRFVDGHNYNGVFVSRGFNRAGTEQLVNNVRVNQQIPFFPSAGTRYHADVYVQGDHVDFYVDGAFITSWDLPPSSLAGPLAFESYSGNIDLFQGYTTTVAISNVAIFGPE